MRPFWMKVLGLGLGGVGSWGAQAARLGEGAVCEIYREVYHRDIERKLRGGVPFELMALWLQDGQVVARRVVHLSYDLWDEVITVKEEERVLKRIPSKQGAAEVCRFLEPPTGDLKSGTKIIYKLLLNPLWAGRVARLKASSALPGGEVGILHVNWDRVARELDPETTLLSQELSL
jgi:hypothetical protein